MGRYPTSWPTTSHPVSERLRDIETTLGLNIQGDADTVANRLANNLYSNVKDFGAIGDGSTDDLAAIN